MRTSNPALNAKVFQYLSYAGSEQMTIQGTVNKCFMLVALLFVTAIWSWNNTMPTDPTLAPNIPGWYIIAIIGTFILSFVIIFVKTTAPYLAPVYALGEGMVLGTISAVFETQYPGIAFQAILCTAGTCLALLMAYRSGWIQATENFKLGVFAATGGIALVYLIDFGLTFFGMKVPFIHDAGPIGIGVSVVITVVAALNLVLDFDFIEKGAQQGAPKYMEWYASFGLLITLVWLYLEILRLLSKLRKN